jgi:membrane associated rhomboid family serine protease
MRPASVGFQCPECVNEGTRATRSGRTAYGGLRSHNPARTSQVLIALNVAVWLLITVTGGTRSPWVDRLALIPQGVLFPVPGGGVEHIAGVADGAPWQLVTSMFTHVAIWHIGFNMLALWFLGPQLEAAVGRARFLALYLLSGLTGSLVVYWFAPLHQPTIGASGAIFGLMGGLLVIALKVKADPSQLLIWIGLNFLITFLNLGTISWQGHLGGFFGGALVAAIIAYAPRKNRGIWQWVGFGLLAVALIVAYVVRTLMLT